MSEVSTAESVQIWLDAFDSALRAGDAELASSMFEEDGFWRDLVSFTWNIKTLEGPVAIKAMLDACVSEVKPSNWAIEETPTEADGLIESWITFETAVARGRGHLRLRNGKAWTLLTTMVELKGHEEPTGELRNMWKPVQQPGLWFHGGNLHQSSHYSQFLSLQIKARMEGVSTHVYGLADVHHLQ